MVYKILKNKKGVSLIEIIVATALFAVAILTATQIFQMAMTGQRNAIASQNVEENLRYVFEVISKEIRYVIPEESNSCGFGMADGDLYNSPAINILEFKNSSDQCVTYQMDPGGTKFFIVRDGVGLDVTPNEILVSELAFDVIPYADNSRQSQVTVKMKVRAVGKEIHKSEMVVQTTITPRYYKN